jgi:aspartate carbamoyltransferase regulatory subunit
MTEAKSSAQAERVALIEATKDSIREEKVRHRGRMKFLEGTLLEALYSPGCTHQDEEGVSSMHENNGPYSRAWCEYCEEIDPIFGSPVK